MEAVVDYLLIELVFLYMGSTGRGETWVKYDKFAYPLVIKDGREGM